MRWSLAAPKFNNTPQEMRKGKGIYTPGSIDLVEGQPPSEWIGDIVNTMFVRQRLRQQLQQWSSFDNSLQGASTTSSTTNKLRRDLRLRSTPSTRSSTTINIFNEIFEYNQASARPLTTIDSFDETSTTSQTSVTEGWVDGIRWLCQTNSRIDWAFG